MTTTEKTSSHRPPPRHEANGKVLGSARYTADEQHDGLLHAALVLADEACGDIVAIDIEVAEQMPGVVGVFTHQNLPPVRDAGVLRLCVGTRIHHRGQPLAIVIADTLSAARAAAARVRATIASLPARAALGDASEGLFAPPTAGRVPTDTARGDADAALAASDVTVDARFETAANVHLAMEPHVSTVAWGRADDGSPTVHLFTSTQAVHATRRVMAHMLGLPGASVRVTCRLIGGGFGAKGQLWWSHTALLAQAARQLGRPVRLELTRTDTFHQVGRRSPSRQRVRLGASRDGKVTAIIHEAAHETSPYGEYCDSTAATSRWLYGCADVRTAHRLARVNAPQPIPMRAPGTGPGQFALESAIDQMAQRLGIDPLELRLRNLPERDRELDLPWSSFSLRECLRVGAEAFGWASRAGAGKSTGNRAGNGNRNGNGAKSRDGRWQIGCGMASAAYHVYRQSCRVEVTCTAPDRCVVRCGTQDMGSGTFTAIARIAATALGCDPTAVTVEIGDTMLPEGPYTGGSMVTGSVAPAVAAAARELRARLDAGELPTFDQPLTTHAHTEPDAAPATSTYATGAVFVRVRVDTLTGEVRVSHITAAYAAGRIVDPLMVRSQYIGGLIGGIGMALHEASVTDPSQARIVNDDLCGYLVPVHADMPVFDIRLVDEQDPVIGEGIKGVGMLGTCGTAAAIANAVFDATGVRVQSLPIRLEHLLDDGLNSNSPDQEQDFAESADR